MNQIFTVIRSEIYNFAALLIFIKKFKLLTKKLDLFLQYMYNNKVSKKTCERGGMADAHV